MLISWMTMSDQVKHIQIVPADQWTWYKMIWRPQVLTAALDRDPSWSTDKISQEIPWDSDYQRIDDIYKWRIVISK